MKGEGNSVNYKYRMHDPRIGRFFAIDPLAPKYPYYSPYQFSGNEVISKVELEGLEPGVPPLMGYDPLTNEMFNSMIKEHKPHLAKWNGLHFWKYVNTKGWVFEDGFIRSTSNLSKNNKMNSSGSIPDGVGSFSMYIDVATDQGIKDDWYFFTDNIYFEVKAYKNDVFLTKQIKAHINGLANDSDQQFDVIDSAADEGGAALILITFHGGKVSPSVITYAMEKNVSIIQKEALYNADLNKIMFTKGKILYQANVPDFPDADDGYIQSILDYYYSSPVELDWGPYGRDVYGKSNEGGQDQENRDFDMENNY